MPELEQLVRADADETLAGVAPVSAAEARRRGRPRPSRVWAAGLVAAIAVAAIGVTAILVRFGEGEKEVTAVGGSYPLTLDGHRDWMLAFLNGERRPTTRSSLSGSPPSSCAPFPRAPFATPLKG